MSTDQRKSAFAALVRGLTGAAKEALEQQLSTERSEHLAAEGRLKAALARVEELEQELRSAASEMVELQAAHETSDELRTQLTLLEAELVAERSRSVELAAAHQRVEGELQRLSAATRERSAHLESNAMGPTSDQRTDLEALEDELREREALIEELESALRSQRTTIEQRDRRLTEQAAELDAMRASSATQPRS